MNYQETITYLYKHLPMFSRVGAVAYKADLHNTIALCNAFNNPQNKYKTIHIAGTNGKGSTSHMLASILQAQGYKVGLYTSPHIKDFRERIRVNGQMMEEQAVIDFVEESRAITAEIQPSFFELTVAMAFNYFALKKVDIAVIETGLGGLLDSTNIITPILSIITNIGYDHQHILGNTLQEIATQKAGIIKQNVPVVVGETLKETKSIFTETSYKNKAEVFFAEDEFVTIKSEILDGKLKCIVKNNFINTESSYIIDLTGIYQAKNICTVLKSIGVLKEIGYPISNEALQFGLASTKQTTGLRGRWEILQNNPIIITDVAHNRDGIIQILSQLNSQHLGVNLHFVLGFVKDKDIEGVLSLFPKNEAYYFTNAHIPRALPYRELAEKANAMGLMGKGFDDVNKALDAAKKNATNQDVILVCGSFFIIAELNDF